MVNKKQGSFRASRTTFLFTTFETTISGLLRGHPDFRQVRRANNIARLRKALILKNLLLMSVSDLLYRKRVLVVACRVFVKVHTTAAVPLYRCAGRSRGALLTFGAFHIYDKFLRHQVQNRVTRFPNKTLFFVTGLAHAQRNRTHTAFKALTSGRVRGHVSST